MPFSCLQWVEAWRPVWMECPEVPFAFGQTDLTDENSTYWKYLKACTTSASTGASTSASSWAASHASSMVVPMFTATILVLFFCRL
jgi:hypothetical protein